MDKLNKESFLDLAKAIHIPQHADLDFLYDLYSDCKDSLPELASTNDIISRMPVNDIALIIYLANEHLFYLAANNIVDPKPLEEDERYIGMIESIALDKYYTNEHLSYKNGTYSNRFQPEISTLSLYLNFILGTLSRYKQGSPNETLIVDVMKKGFSMAQCILSLLMGGFETEAFSTWRTLHENESILQCLVRYGQPTIQAYLRHLRYALAFRGAIPSKEETDAVFVDIKTEMKAHDLKSKDMKRFIEYGWLYSIPDLEKDEGFKLNFRDGVERAANLRFYSKTYEMSSEIAHSSPLLIYSEKGYYHLITLINLYESFFRLEKIFSSLYLSNASEDEKTAYKRMQTLYQGELSAAYSFLQKRLEKMSASAPKKAEAFEGK